MNLNEAIDQVKAIDGYVYHRLRAEDHYGMVQCYTFWFARGDGLRDYEVRFLVADKDTPEESAWIYSTKHIHVAETPFRDTVIQKIPLFQNTNPEYEKIIIISLSERDEVAELHAYKYDSVTELSEKLSLVVFKKDDVLVVRKLV